MKSLFIAALAAVCVAFAGCASAPVPLTIPTPAQLASQVCPIVNADLNALASSTLLTSAQQTTLKDIESVNATVCSAGAAVSVSSLQAFNSTAFPALIAIVAAVPAIPNQPAILLALTLAQPLVTQVVNAAVAAATPVAPASAVPAASAPVPASA